MDKFKPTTLLLLLTVWISVMSADFDDVGLPLITHFSQEDYKAHHANWDIHQADNGLIYIANGNGLLEYDGETFNHYYSPSKTGVRDIELVGDQIHIGTLNNIGYYQPNVKGVLQYHSLNDYVDKENYPFGEIYSVKSYKDKVIYKSMGYFFIWDGISITTVADETNSYVKTIEVNELLYTKLLGDENIYTLDLNSQKLLKQTGWKLPKDSQVKDIELGKNGELIFFTAHSGIYKQQGEVLNLVDGVLEKNVFIYDAIKTNNELFYVATINAGLFILSDELKVVKNYKDIHGLKISQIAAILQDKQNNIWTVGYNGLNVMRPPDEVSTYAKADNMYGFGFANIQGKPSFLGKRILQLQNNTENPLYPPTFESIGDVEGIKNSLDYKDKTFLCTNNGLYLIKVGDNQITEKQLVFDKTQYVFDIAATDDFEHVFISTNLGVFQIKNKGGEWESELIQGLDFELNNLEVENNEFLWVGSRTSQLYKLKINGINSNSQSLVKFDEKDGLGKNLVIPFKLSSGMVFGTNDGTMRFSKTENKLQSVDSLPEIFNQKDLAVEMMYEDQNQNIWYTINNHQGFINKGTGKWQQDDRLFNYFPPRFNSHYVSLKDKVLWFMQTGGEMFRMDVERTTNLAEISPLYVRELKNINTDETILSGTINQVENEFDFSSNSIRVRYALADYATPNRAMYRTKLNGSQNPQWSSWTSETYKDFTELRGNDYILEVQAKDAFGRITPSTELSFTVLPPYYLATKALVVYFIFGILILIFLTWLVLKIRTNKLIQENARLDQLVKNKTQHLNSKAMDLELVQKAKDRFFTNFSHELRTPLSLIMAPIEQVQAKHYHHLLDVAMSNANKLKHQINRIFDLGHLNDPVIKLQTEYCDVCEITLEVTQEFEPWAEKHEQLIKTTFPKKAVYTLLDPEKYQAVISNLISNAIKYSGAGAEIQVSILGNKKEISVAVKDNGPGIPNKLIPRLFERFQADESHNISQQTSVGVGLAYALEIMRTHEGDLQLLSGNQGAEFLCKLPVLDKPHEINYVNNSEEIKLAQEDHPVLMVVEDNDELREVLTKILSEAYVVYEFGLATDALKQVQHIMPDAIISDVMMPELDGVSFTKKLRELEICKTTPIILLTAKVAQSDIHLGLEAGATDYMLKPFSPKELLLRVQNHIHTIHAIRQGIKVDGGLKDSRSEFLKALDGSIVQSIKEGSLTTSQLAKNMFMDRTTLFRKIKKETNQSPTQYLMEFRLNLAKKQLKQQHNSISEVAYFCGFDSLSYFSTCFKKQFKINPSEYIS